MAGLVEMQIESVRVHMLSNRHVVILKDNAGDRYLPIWIGAWEASAIAMRLQGLQAERPLTHDLFAAALERLGVQVRRVVISELSDETYHARIHMERDGVEVEVDARPSDALALAVRAGVEIYADEAVLSQAALAADPDEESAEDDEAADDEAESEASDRPRRRARPIESVGAEDAPVDPRLDMFRDFINSLEADPNAGGDSGGRRSS
ncbi:MAG TPA: bifunctional nuclease family protein [Candidatus Limnocylindria bacterium]|nr:bifunctional nuclease family protein [Candidatus Limnocylindria bacterium]